MLCRSCEKKELRVPGEIYCTRYRKSYKEYGSDAPKYHCIPYVMIKPDGTESKTKGEDLREAVKNIKALDIRISNLRSEIEDLEGELQGLEEDLMNSEDERNSWKSVIAGIENAIEEKVIMAKDCPRCEEPLSSFF